MSNCFGRFSSPVIIDSLLALFAAGVFLSLVRLRTGNIAQCIGIHAGWVLVIKVTKSISTVNYESGWGFLVGTYDGVIGFMGFAWLCLLSISYYWLGTRR